MSSKEKKSWRCDCFQSSWKAFSNTIKLENIFMFFWCISTLALPVGFFPTFLCARISSFQLHRPIVVVLPTTATDIRAIFFETIDPLCPLLQLILVYRVQFYISTLKWPFSKMLFWFDPISLTEKISSAKARCRLRFETLIWRIGVICGKFWIVNKLPPQSDW